VLIFDHIRRDKMEADWIWKIQEYLSFRNSLVPPLKENCDSEMLKMCEEGIFEEVKEGLRGYRLTKKGYAAVWSC